jgi:hypothetical protein
MYKVIIRSEIFREAIFMASESASALLSAAVIVTISMPVYAKNARVQAVLKKVDRLIEQALSLLKA